MKLKYLVCACALTSMSAMANDNIASNAVVTENEEAVETAVVESPEPEYSVVDGEFGGSSLSNNETLMAGTPTDGHRLEEWSKAQKPTVKFGGYIIGKYSWENPENSANAGGGFNLRLVRLYVDGYVFKDFKYRLQLEVNKTPHIKDATLEWVHWKQFSIKAGQFKRAFTFEDPYNPFDVGVGDYSQLVKKLSGFSDRTAAEYNGSNGGRDLGLQVQGDLFPSKKDKHAQLHYQLAVYNGQGINTADADKKKDFIGTVQYVPIKNLYIGAFGWKGTYTASGVTVNRNRFDFGVKYESDWTVRAEYARSYGHKISDYVDGVLTKNKGNYTADAFYATLGIPCAKWLKAYVKYDLYRDFADTDNMNSIYSAALNFKFTKNLFFQAQYNYVDKKVVDTHTGYSQLWAEMYVRF